MLSNLNLGNVYYCYFHLTDGREEGIPRREATCSRYHKIPMNVSGLLLLFKKKLRVIEVLTKFGFKLLAV